MFYFARFYKREQEPLNIWNECTAIMPKIELKVNQYGVEFDVPDGSLINKNECRAYISLPGEPPSFMFCEIFESYPTIGAIPNSDFIQELIAKLREIVEKFQERAPIGSPKPPSYFGDHRYRNTCIQGRKALYATGTLDGITGERYLIYLADNAVCDSYYYGGIGSITNSMTFHP